jgi:hypothetical protein
VSPLDVAIGIVGLVVIIHASPFELKRKPFVCGFCLSFWLAAILAPFVATGVVHYLLCVGATALLAGVVSAYSPFFRTLLPTALEEKHVQLPDLPYRRGADETDYAFQDLPNREEDLLQLLEESDECVLGPVRTDLRCFGDSTPACGELECPHCAQPVDGLGAVRDAGEGQPASPSREP